MLAQCWAIVYDAGPALSQHWTNVLCLLGPGKRYLSLGLHDIGPEHTDITLWTMSTLSIRAIYTWWNI